MPSAKLTSKSAARVYFSVFSVSILISGISVDVSIHSKIRMEQILILVSISSGETLVCGVYMCVCEVWGGQSDKVMKTLVIGT